jgi:hypothetical protein
LDTILGELAVEALVRSADRPAEKGGDRDVVTITFGTGEMSGVFVKDKICVGAICTRGNFVSATEESDEPFSLVPFDGIFGLALSQMSEGNGFNVFDCMVHDKVLKSNAFAVFFGAGDKEDSEISFGEYKRERMASELFYAKVSTPGYWQVEMEDITIANSQALRPLHKTAHLPYAPAYILQMKSRCLPCHQLQRTLQMHLT